MPWGNNFFFFSLGAITTRFWLTYSTSLFFDKQETELIKMVAEQVCGALEEAHHLTLSMDTKVRARLEKDYHCELARLAKANCGAEEREKLTHDFHDHLKRTPVPRSMRSDGKIVRNKIHITLHEYAQPRT